MIKIIKNGLTAVKVSEEGTRRTIVYSVKSEEVDEKELL